MSDHTQNEADLRNKENKDGDSLAERKRWRTVSILNRRLMTGWLNLQNRLIQTRSPKINPSELPKQTILSGIVCFLAWEIIQRKAVRSVPVSASNTDTAQFPTRSRPQRIIR